jgi:hypothetical protein
MTREPITSPTDVPQSGLLLPPDVVQPFFLRFRRDDVHVMAFFIGHPRYEAVEAMIQERASGEHSIRAILTRHDQSQIDHINDAALLAQMRGARREVCRRAIDFASEPFGGGRRARLEFKSNAGERVVLCITTLGEPDARGAGLTDPGGHSASASLPLMLRGASALAGPESWVTVDGVRYDLPAKSLSGSAVGADGYYTEGHAMGVIRAGSVTRRLIGKPDRLEVGAKWTFQSGGKTTTYRIAARDSAGRLRIETVDGSGEVVTARALDGRLAVSKIEVGAVAPTSGGLALAFDDAGGFSLSMAGTRDLVTGLVDIEESAKGALITLRPATPDWAADRAVRVAISRRGQRLRFLTMIGGDPPERP